MPPIPHPKESSLTNRFRPAALVRLVARGVLILAVAAGPVIAQDAPLPRPRPVDGRFTFEQTTALDTINTYFNAVRTMRGEFIQIGPDQLQLSEGVFYMARPGRVRFEYYPPSQLLIISNGSTLQVENKAARTRDRYPLARTPLAPLLAGYTDLTTEANVRDIRIEDDLIAVVLTEGEGGGWLTLYFDRVSYELRQWVTFDPQGYIITFVIYNLAVNQPIDETLFELEAPDPGRG